MINRKTRAIASAEIVDGGDVETRTSTTPASQARLRNSGRPGSDAQAVGRNAIVDSACALLRTVPPGRITRSEVSRHANVDPSLVRYYFRDAESLLLAMAAQLTDAFAGRVRLALRDADETPTSQLRARISGLLSLQVEYPYFHQLISQAVMQSDDPKAKQLMAELTTGGMNAYQDIIDAGQRDGTLRKVDGKLLFLAIIGICETFVTGMPMLQYARGTDAPLDIDAERKRYESFVCDLVLRGLAV